jgi:hypothetical protein
MNSPHTPGPWTCVPTTAIGRHPETRRLDIVHHSGEFGPAFLAGDVHPNDAHLIASAPDLLRALEGILSIRPDYHAGRDDLWLNRGEVERIARAAIARAKGLE